MQDIIDLLQIKIERAKAQLPEDTLNAIAAVDWRAVILGMRISKGYTFEQLGDLELETELLLCGLLTPENYPRELENRMKITKIQANELVDEMNKLVFAKIREELIKNTERKRVFANRSQEPVQDDFVKLKAQDTEEEKKRNTQILNSAGIKIINKIDLTIPELKAGSEKPAASAFGRTESAYGETQSAKSFGAPKEEIHPMLVNKLSGSFQIPAVKTEYTLDNITKSSATVHENAKAKIPNIDPYREIPE